MSRAHVHDPHDELDGLVREAMGQSGTQAQAEVARGPMGFVLTDVVGNDSNVIHLTARISDAVLQGYLEHLSQQP